MNSIKIVTCIAALILLVAFIAPVSAFPNFGYSLASSKYDGSGLSLSSSLGASSIGTSGTSQLGYSVGVKGTGERPTLGDMNTFASFSSQTLNQKISYSEATSASGIIYSFSKVISFT
jgi:hypothetical protein